jgi:hypothetical protein
MPTPFRPLLPALAALAFLLSPAPARAFTTVNPGVMISYTFGRGVTYGFELSVVRHPETIDDWKEQPYGVGVALDIGTNFKDLFKMRLGGEIVGPFIGVEAGPALVIDRSGTRLGFGITPWAGYYVMPYYTYTFTFGDGPNLHEVGTYLKVFLTTEGDGASHSDDWD